jgi:hypothetical protein
MHLQIAECSTNMNHTNVTSPHTNVTSPHTNVTSPHTNVTSPHTNVISPHTNVTSSHTRPSARDGSPAVLHVELAHGSCARTRTGRNWEDINNHRPPGAPARLLGLCTCNRMAHQKIHSKCAKVIHGKKRRTHTFRRHHFSRKRRFECERAVGRA